MTRGSFAQLQRIDSERWPSRSTSSQRARGPGLSERRAGADETRLTERAEISRARAGAWVRLSRKTAVATTERATSTPPARAFPAIRAGSASSAVERAKPPARDSEGCGRMKDG